MRLLTGMRLCTIIITAVLLAAGCDSMNTGTFPPVLGPRNIRITGSSGLLIGVDASWTASWVDGYAPYNYTWDFGGGAEPNVITGTTEDLSSVVVVEMLGYAITSPDTFTMAFTLTDSLGRSCSRSLNYSTRYGPNLSPIIDSAVYTEATRTLVVTVSSPDDNETMTVDVTIPSGLTVDAASKVASQTGPLTVSFVWSAENYIAGGSGITTINVTDQDGGTAHW